MAEARLRTKDTQRKAMTKDAKGAKSEVSVILKYVSQ